MSDLEADIAAMRDVLHATSDSELAAMLGLGRSAISQWRRRGVIPDSARSKASFIAEHLDRYANSARQVAALPQQLATYARALAIAYIYRSAGSGPSHLEDALPRLAAAFDQIMLAAVFALRRSAQGSGLNLESAYGTLLIDENLERAINDAMLPSLLPQ